MAFDRTNPADLAALHAEVNNDPILMGYAAVIDNTTQLLKLINDPGNNAGGETAGVQLTVGLLLEHMLPSDFDAVQVSDGERRYIESFLGRDFSLNIERYRPQIVAAFRANSTTVSNLNALSRPLSRAEVLFGEGTVIVRDDWIAARDIV